MNNKKELNDSDELEELYKNPMFRISLGSKELFHSNFLAFLWDCDKQAFLNMIYHLLPEGKKINVNELLKKDELTIYREKENLDLCIYYSWIMEWFIIEFIYYL